MALHLISSRGDYREVLGLQMGAGGPLHFIRANSASVWHEPHGGPLPVARRCTCRPV